MTETGVDEAGTAALRAEMAPMRGDVGVFDFGPDIETLRVNCQAETGLPAPRRPVWAHAA